MLTAREVSRLAGFKKPWMLNHLERERTFVPEIPKDGRHGIHRNYTFRDLVVLRAINRILELGARPARIRAAIHAFADACPEVIGDITMKGVQLKFAQQAGHFVVNADSVLYCSKDQVIDLLSQGQLAFSFMIDSRAVTTPCLQAATEIIQLGSVQRRGPHALEKIAQRYNI
jgi:DNA-binding transcriptional MerR regulator